MDRVWNIQFGAKPVLWLRQNLAPSQIKTPFAIFILINCILFQSVSSANYVRCSSISTSAKWESNIKTYFDHSIPNELRSVIAEAVREVYIQIESLPEDNKPQAITFKRIQRSEFNWGDSADPRDDVIKLSPASFKLSKKTFKALVAHELTHLVIYRKFKASTGKSLFHMVKGEPDKESTIFTIQSHTPLAELLADLMGVIVTKDPTVFKNMIRELLIYWPLEVSKNWQSEGLDMEFGQRDFSIDPYDLKWKNYTPHFRGDHNFLNHIRSYLWHDWISKIPPSKQGLFFNRVLTIFSDLFETGAFDRLRYSYSVPEINRILIDHLKSELSKEFSSY